MYGYLAIETLLGWGRVDHVGRDQLELVGVVAMIAEVLKEQSKTTGLAAHVGDWIGFAKHGNFPSSFSLSIVMFILVCTINGRKQR